jgi:hypothetical protein
MLKRCDLKTTAMSVLLLCSSASAFCQSKTTPAPKAADTGLSEGAQINPKISTSLPNGTLGFQTQAVMMGRNELANLQLLPATPSNLLPKLIPNVWPSLKLESIPTVWPKYQVTPILLK